MCGIDVNCVFEKPSLILKPSSTTQKGDIANNFQVDFVFES